MRTETLISVFWNPERLEALKKRGCGVINCHSGLNDRSVLAWPEESKTDAKRPEEHGDEH